MGSTDVDREDRPPATTGSSKQEPALRSRAQEEPEYDDFGLCIRRPQPSHSAEAGRRTKEDEASQESVAKPSKEDSSADEGKQVSFSTIERGSEERSHQAQSTAENRGGHSQGIARSASGCPTSNGRPVDKPLPQLPRSPSHSRHSSVQSEHESEGVKPLSFSQGQMQDGKSQRKESVSSKPAGQGTENVDEQVKPASDGPAVSEWSHQRLASCHEKPIQEEEKDEWKTMPAFAEYDLYDDDGKLLARGAEAEDEEEAVYGGLGGAGKGYTRIQLDEDAKSATSMDEDTNYLFKENQAADESGDESQRDAVSQLQATKDLLTEGQRIAYVGVTRLAIHQMNKFLEDIEPTRGTKKDLSKAVEDMSKWGQQMMVRLYAHMEIDPAEQIMIEQLAEHGVQPADLVPPLMQTSKVANPMAGEKEPRRRGSERAEAQDDVHTSGKDLKENVAPESESGETVPRVSTPSQMEQTAKIDLDLRWTVMCDLFLLLISESVYDSRSRRLLEQVADGMNITWMQICRFEKRVIDALEVQEEREKETWNEEEHMENRRKLGLKKKYMVMGIATVGGGLVIGLSAGLLAPVIGAGLAAGFTTIGVTGTAGFLGGVGGAAVITSAATAAGGTIAVRASHRRTGAVQTFEYRPLHNNKRLNLILTVSGWMNGKVDDVRLPYSTVDPIMGDIYSLLWEPEMLQSMGDTINILATEALTQTVQQVLGSTVLVALMASLQLPIILSKLSYLIDNPWTVSLDRANAAGLILADSLIDRHLGNRPVTLLGFSLGSRVIFSCLKELANRRAYGVVQNVYLFGSPIVAKGDEYLRARSVTSGRFVNGYASNDWILGYLFRATSGGIMRVAGLAPVEDIPGLENIDVTHLVNGHMAYRTAMPKLLREVGWEVESDEFTEIEDPDPENHQKRQRELIREIDEARKQAEVKPEKTRFGFFKRGKLAEKKGWETYQADGHPSEFKRSTSTEGTGVHRDHVLFDIDAIKRELASEMIEVRQLESTLPPIQVQVSRPDPGQEAEPARLRRVQSSELSPEYQKGAVRRGLDRSTTQPLPNEVTNIQLPPRPSEIDDQPSYTNGYQSAFTSNKIHNLESRPPAEEEEEQQQQAHGSHGVLSPPFSGFPSHWARDSPSSEPVRSATTPASVTSGFGAMQLERNAWAEDQEDSTGRR